MHRTNPPSSNAIASKTTRCGKIDRPPSAMNSLEKVAVPEEYDEEALSGDFWLEDDLIGTDRDDSYCWNDRKTSGLKDEDIHMLASIYLEEDELVSTDERTSGNTGRPSKHSIVSEIKNEGILSGISQDEEEPLLREGRTVRDDETTSLDYVKSTEINREDMVRLREALTIITAYNFSTEIKPTSGSKNVETTRPPCLTTTESLKTSIGRAKIDSAFTQPFVSDDVGTGEDETKARISGPYKYVSRRFLNPQSNYSSIIPVKDSPVHSYPSRPSSPSSRNSAMEGIPVESSAFTKYNSIQGSISPSQKNQAKTIKKSIETRHMKALAWEGVCEEDVHDTILEGTSPILVTNSPNPESDNIVLINSSNTDTDGASTNSDTIKVNFSINEKATGNIVERHAKTPPACNRRASLMFHACDPPDDPSDDDSIDVNTIWKSQDNSRGTSATSAMWKYGSSKHLSFKSVDLAVDRKYPQDCYSFLALYGPFRREERKFFLFGLVPFLFQMIFLMLLVWSVMDEKRGTVGENDNPASGTGGILSNLATFIPANANRIVRATQVTSIAAYVIFPDSSLQDVIRAVRCFPRPSEARVDDPVGSMRVSCILRGLQGILAVFAALLLVVTSDTVIDIILNFTALNFISNLDDAAFYLAMSGEFGPALMEEADKIAEKDLPNCMYKATKHIYYRVVVAVIAVILFGLTTLVIVAQQNPHVWITRTLRVQFQGNTGLKQYSGCFEINDDAAPFYHRHTYNSYDRGTGNTSFGYCREDRQWILFMGNEDDFDPCEAKESEVELARSSKTDAFDISTSFDGSWVSASNTPLDLYFFDSRDEQGIIDHCDSVLGDGVCDPFFNVQGYQFDGGDCCASTCTHSSCGRGGLTSPFGWPFVSGYGFPYCSDPRMVPITIHLNDIQSSLNQATISSLNNWFKSNEIDADEWIAKKHHRTADPYFALDCNGRKVLTVYVTESMVGNSETVMVEDGANCTLVVRNTVPGVQDPLSDDWYPIWYIDYTIFHGDKTSDEKDQVQILTQNSARKENVHFQRIPKCYFTKLQHHVDISTIYTASSASNKAIDWLLEGGVGISQCEDEYFVERYALTSMAFTLTGNASHIGKDDQCTWPSITCKDGQVNTLNLGAADLRGALPSEVGLLPNLRQLQLSGNQISSLPATVSKLEKLQQLGLSNNQIVVLPTDIGLLKSLEILSLSNNQIRNLPTEIGNLKSLQKITLDGNHIHSLPTEIGQLTNLQELRLADNDIEYIPSEIGLLTSLKVLDLVPLWALFLSSRAAHAQDSTEAPPQRPNIIVMQPDDFAFMDEWTPPPKNPNTNTDDENNGFPPSGLPNLERLRTGGLQMMQAYTTSPVCGTSRYSTITGKYPSRAASVREEDNERYPNESGDPAWVVIPTTKLVDTEEQQDCSTENVATTLKDAGYRTAMFGKWHLSRFTEDTYSYEAGVETVQSCGFDTVGGLYVENMGGRADYFADGTFAHNMEWITWEAIKFLNETSQTTQDTPFFMYFNPTVPHSHVNLEDSLDNFSCRDTPDPNQEWDSDPFVKGMSEGEGCQAYRETIYERAEGDYDALGKIWMDDAVGALLAALEDNGQLENTIFLFQNDHGLGPKGTIYEGGVRIPQFVHYPAGIAPGTIFRGLVSTIDVAATMLDYAGIPKAPYPMDGKSWKNALGNPGSESYWEQDRCLFFENERDRAVRCGCYKYMDLFDEDSKTYTRGNRFGMSYGTGGLLFDLCDGGDEYITDHDNNREIEDTDESDTTFELRNVLDCHLKHTDRENPPDVSVCGATEPTSAPTKTPTENPTDSPTDSPSQTPADSSTSSPTHTPIQSLTNTPTHTPSNSPVALPDSAESTAEDDETPSGPLANEAPTDSSTGSPTQTPIQSPTQTPNDSPMVLPASEALPQEDAVATDSSRDSPTQILTQPPTHTPTDSPLALPDSQALPRDDATAESTAEDEKASADQVVSGELEVNGDGDESITMSLNSAATTASGRSIMGVTLAMALPLIL